MPGGPIDRIAGVNQAPMRDKVPVRPIASGSHDVISHIGNTVYGRDFNQPCLCQRGHATTDGRDRLIPDPEVFNKTEERQRLCPTA